MERVSLTFSEVVTTRLKELGETAFSIEQKHGLPADALRNVGRSEKQAGPRLSRVEDICSALGLEIYIGPPRTPIPDHQKVGDDYVRIPRYEAQLAAGAGSLNAENSPISSLAFRMEWFARKAVNPKRCVIVEVSGDSMEPTVFNGDLVMIDQQATTIRDLRLYAFVDANGDARVKRFQKFKDCLILISDNKSNQAEMRTMDEANQMTIIGQVVWSGHDFER